MNIKFASKGNTIRRFICVSFALFSMVFSTGVLAQHQGTSCQRACCLEYRIDRLECEIGFNSCIDLVTALTGSGLAACGAVSGPAIVICGLIAATGATSASLYCALQESICLNVAIRDNTTCLTNNCGPNSNLR